MRATAGLRAARGRPREVRHQGRQALHRRVVRGLARLEADRRGGQAVLRQVRRARASRTSTSTRARRSGRWTRTPSTSPTSTTSATDYNGELNFIVEHVGLPRIEDFCFMATQEPNVYAGLAGRRRRPDARPPEVLREGHGRAAVLGRRGQDAVRLRLRDLGAEVADRGPRRLGDARRRSPTRTSRGWTSTARRRSSGSTPRSCTASRCPAELRGHVPAEAARRRGDAQWASR